MTWVGLVTPLAGVYATQTLDLAVQMKHNKAPEKEVGRNDLSPKEQSPVEPKNVRCEGKGAEMELEQSKDTYSRKEAFNMQMTIPI